MARCDHGEAGREVELGQLPGQVARGRPEVPDFLLKNLKQACCFQSCSMSLLSVVPGVFCSKPSQSSISKLASFSLPSCWLLPSVDMRFSTVPNPLSMLLPFYLLFNCHFFSLSHHLSLYLVLIYRFMHFKGFAMRICTGAKMSASVQSMGFFLGYTLFIYSLIFHLIENNMILHLA